MLWVIEFKSLVYFADGIVSENTEGLVMLDALCLFVYMANDDLFRLFGNLDSHDVGKAIDADVTSLYFATEGASA